MDPILNYLLEFNETNSIEYKGRYLVPPGGLAKMLDEFQGFRLNTEVVVKPLEGEAPEPEPHEATLEELLNALD